MFTNVTEDQALHTGTLAQQTGRKGQRLLWHRLHLAIDEMNYATRRLYDVQTSPVSDGPTEPATTQPRRIPAIRPRMA